MNSENTETYDDSARTKTLSKYYCSDFCEGEVIESENSKECPICYFSYDSKPVALLGICKHAICESCYLSWFLE